VQALASLDRGWVANAGQWDEQAAFSAPGYFGTTWVTKEGELRHVASKENCEKRTPEASEPEPAGRRFRKPCPVQSWVLAERWVGGKVKGIRGEEQLETKVSYFLGNDPAKHRSGLASYRYLSLGEVWPGVEVKLKASQKTVEKLFYLRPGANLGKVRVELEGAQNLRLSQEGELVIETGLGELKLSKPVAWQEKDGQKLPVQASYRLFGKNRYGFAVQGADPALPLVIDPILQATYLGGSGDDFAYALAIAPSGDVYVAGETESTNFPRTAGGGQPSHGGGIYNAFVARLNASLTEVLQSTYLGGSGSADAHALAIAPSGDVYVAGDAGPDFPHTECGAQESHRGGGDGFVAQLSASLADILQATYVGGSGWDKVHALAIAPGGDVYVAGRTQSSDLPNTAGGAQPAHARDYGYELAPEPNTTFISDAFVVRLNGSLTQVVQSTYLGGDEADEANALAIAPNGDVYVAGTTGSGNFPHTEGGAQETVSVSDAFVARLNAGLTQILQATYLGGNGIEEAYALAIAPNGEVYVTGETSSTDFPHTAGGAQASLGGLRNAFVVRLNAALTQNLQATYVGGRGYSQRACALAIAPSGDVYVAGYTESRNFPKTAGGAQPRYGGGFDDAFVARLNAPLTSILQSTYLGGIGFDRAFALAIGRGSEVYVAGQTTLGESSSDPRRFPSTAGGAQASYGGGGYDGFVARLSADLAGATATTRGGLLRLNVWVLLALVSLLGIAGVALVRRQVRAKENRESANVDQGPRQEKLFPAEKSCRVVTRRSRWTNGVLACLMVSLVPNLLLVVMALGHSGWDRDELGHRVDLGSKLALLCLPLALMCIARLLTEGVYEGHEGGGVGDRCPRTVGFGRVLLLAASLALPLIGIFLLACPFGLVLAFAPFLSLPIGVCLGFWAGLGISARLLRRWGLSVHASNVYRRIAAAAYGLVVGSELGFLGLAVLMSLPRC
jgi:hypothetical protein